MIASYVFYGWWDWRFLSLLMISTIVDFNCAGKIYATSNQATKKKYLLLSLLVNLGILGFFKYFNFFADSAIKLLNTFGFSPDVTTLNIILPIGISFYTFQTLAYTIDVYRGKEKATKDLVSFAVYVAYFPQLVAGPIERSLNLLPQIKSPRFIKKEQIYTGLQLVLLGYFKKVFIADGAAPFVDECFAAPEKFGGASLVIGVYLFAIQIYGDFSGYSDIARGISRILGIELRHNFKQPYISANITEFWRRWHMSLSSWLRDYLYISLGGNRKGSLKTYRNLMLTMLLGGLWHGAGWTFIIWGGLHGSYLAVHKMILRDKKIGFTEKPKKPLEMLTWLGSVILTFNLVSLSWIFFRANSIREAWQYLTSIDLSFMGIERLLIALTVFGSLTCIVDILCWLGDSEVPFYDSWRPWLKGFAYATMVILISFVGTTGAKPFIYFQF